jgi:hypothetical protein
VAQIRLPVRKIREVLRLKAAGVSDRQIAAAIGSARSTVQECVRRAREAGIGWPLSDECDERALQAQLYQREVPLTSRPRPDFAHLHAELSRPGVTRLLLWQEYKSATPEGWQYSVFCDSVPAMAGGPGTGAAAEPCARRETLRRLRRPEVCVRRTHVDSRSASRDQSRLMSGDG